MKIYYFNDQPNDVSVRIIDATFKSGDSAKNHILKSKEGKVFDVIIPFDSAVFVKNWGGQVLLSYLDPAALGALLQSQD
jgi:hypothetical protein